jgi:HEPN domain-containing protein
MIVSTRSRPKYAERSLRPERPDGAQQAAEKLIKAVLAARGVTFVKSHALSYLIGLQAVHKCPSNSTKLELKMPSAQSSLG